MTELMVGTKKGLFALEGEPGGPFDVTDRAFAGELLASLSEQPVAVRSPIALRDPLTERELTVLRFLPTMMSNAEIADELYVSVNTVKTHVKHLYRKLDVRDRRSAIRRARELRLLGPGVQRIA